MGADGSGDDVAGRNAPFGETTPPRPRRWPTYLAIGFAVLVGLRVVGGFFPQAAAPIHQAGPASKPSADPQLAEPTPPTQPALAPTGNPANDVLLAEDPADRATRFSMMIKQGCRAEKSFYDGISRKGASKGEALWSVSCANGKSFMVVIKPDAGGSATGMDCTVLKAVSGGRDQCFTKF